MKTRCFSKLRRKIMIEGNNIIIRQLELGDEEYLHKWWNDGNMMSHATHAFGTLQSKEAIRRSIMREIENNKMFRGKEISDL